MREPKKSELQSIRLVILNKEELKVLQQHYVKQYNKADKQIRSLKDRFMDEVKTDTFYRKMEYNERLFRESKSNILMIEEILDVTEE